MPPLPPHENAVFQALTGAMAIERSRSLDYTFPVEGGRIVMEAAFIPNRTENGEGLRVLPDPLKVIKKKA